MTTFIEKLFCYLSLFLCIGKQYKRKKSIWKLSQKFMHNIKKNKFIYGLYTDAKYRYLLELYIFVFKNKIYRYYLFATYV